jgi:hypothetical protein
MADKKISALTSASTPLAGTEVFPLVQSGSTVKTPVSSVVTSGLTASFGDVTAITTGIPAITAIRDLDVGVIGDVGQTIAIGAKSGTTPTAGADILGVLEASATSGRFAVRTLTSGSMSSKLSVSSAGDVTANLGNFVVGTAGKGIDFSASTHAAGMTSELLNDYEEGTWTPAFAAWTTAPSVIFATYTKIGRQVTVALYANDGVNAGNQDITGLPFTSSATSAGAAFGSSSAITTVIRGSVTQSSTNITNFPTNNLTGQFWQIVAIYFA